MIKKMKSLLKWLFRKMVQKSFNAGAESVHNLFAYRALSYSQEGEDVILDTFLTHKPVGFYVDVGAHHPQRFSNTKLFYDRGGWHGINIEPNPEVVDLFKEQRPRDIHLCLGISKMPGNLTYYQFAEPACNTLSEKIKEHYEETTLDQVIQTIEVPCVTLRSIFEKHVQDQKVDFLSIGTEGLDFAVLCSNDWEKYRTDLVLVESMHDFMLKNRYRMIARTGLNSYFASEEFLKNRQDIYSW